MKLWKILIMFHIIYYIKIWVRGFFEKYIPKTIIIFFGIEKEDIAFEEYKKLNPLYILKKTVLYDDIIHGNPRFGASSDGLVYLHDNLVWIREYFLGRFIKKI